MLTAIVDESIEQSVLTWSTNREEYKEITMAPRGDHSERTIRVTLLEELSNYTFTVTAKFGKEGSSSVSMTLYANRVRCCSTGQCYASVYVLPISIVLDQLLGLSSTVQYV